MDCLETASGLIAYDERGSGHPIVLLGGGGHSHRDYDELRKLFPRRFRSIGLDWPAHGASPPARGSVSAMRLADIAEEVVECLTPQGAVVVGNSVGGYAAARLAIRRPELVKGLVIINGVGFQGRGPKLRAVCALMGRPWLLRWVYPLFSSWYMRVQTDTGRRALETAVATSRTDPGGRALGELWQSYVSPEHDLRQQARAIAAPTLVLWGRHDPLISHSIGQKIEKTIPNARLRLLDTGHLPHTSDPVGVAAALIPFADAAHGLTTYQPAV